MSDKSDSFSIIVLELSLVLRPLEDAVKSPQAFLKKLGWDTDDIPKPILDLGESAVTLSTIIRDTVEQGFKLENILAVKEVITKTFKAIQAIESSSDADIPQKLRDDNFKTEFPKQVIAYLISEYLLRFHSTIGNLLKAVGVLKTQYRPAISNRPAYIHYDFEFSDLPKVLDDPAILFKNAFKWGSPDFDFDEFARIIENLFYSFGAAIQTDYINPEIFQRISQPTSNILSLIQKERVLKLVFFERQRNNGDRLAGEVNVIKLPTTGIKLPGLALVPKFNGVNAFKMELGTGITLTITSQIDINGGLAVVIRPTEGISLLSGFNNSEVPSSMNGSFKVEADFAGEDGNPTVIVGSSEASRIEYKDLGLSGGIQLKDANNLELYSEIQLRQFKIIIDLKNADGFLSKIIPVDKIESNTDLTFGFSSVKGLYFVGSGGLEISIPTHISLGPLEINDTTIGVKPNAGGIAIPIGLNLKAKLGPLTIVTENIGIQTNVKFPTKEEFVGFSLDFKPPNGVGLSIDAGAVKGGGYLFFDFEKEEYAGALELTIVGSIAAKAIGLITTKMPDGSKGFSMLIIITAEFNPPFQLGYGFTLNAVGGLLGLNRTVLLNPLREGVRTGSVNSIMFPQNVIANAPKIISDLKTIFPPYEGKFLIGPMAKIGWGTPTLISLSLGIIIEIPGNIAILGVLKIALPEERVPLIQIKVLFVGTIDFDKKMITFDASLYESFILLMTLEGDMALRLKWGDSPDFIITVGGFHPSYTPPPLALPTLRRLAINILNTSVSKIRVECYQAVTSNTVQFGAKAELYFGFSAISVEGHIGFDALFQFSPFHFIIQVSASISLKIFGMGVFGIHLDFALEGPNPWRAKGSGGISFFFFDVSADFDITWGDAKNTNVPAINILQTFLDEIKKKEQWSTILTSNKNLLVSLRSFKPSENSDLVLHPAGSLVVQQKLLPLNVKIDKIGNQKVEDVQKISITEARSGGLNLTIKPIDENFARGQYQNLTDAEKLSKPSFEKMPAGVIISMGNNTIKNGKMVRKKIEYEITIIDKEPKKPFSFGSFFTLLNVLFTNFLKGNSVSKSVLSKNYSNKLQPFAEKCTVKEEGYTVAFQSDNKAYNVNASFSSEMMAQTYLNEQLTSNSNLKNVIHIIPNYELQQAS